MWKGMRLRGIQVGESMGIRHRTTRTSGAPSARCHTTHHWAGLAHLRSSRSGYTRVHLLDHSRTGMSSIRMLGGHWMVTGRQAVLRDALVGGKRLRHHHF